MTKESSRSVQSIVGTKDYLKSKKYYVHLKWITYGWKPLYAKVKKTDVKKSKNVKIG